MRATTVSRYRIQYPYGREYLELRRQIEWCMQTSKMKILGRECQGIEETMRAIRDRIEHATSSMGFVSEGVIKLIQFFISRRKSKMECSDIEDLMEEKREGKKKKKK